MKIPRLNTWLLIVAAACFLTFSLSSFVFDALSGIDPRIGVIRDGKAWVKERDSAAFRSATAGAELMNLDVVWTRTTESVTLNLENDETLTMTENTLVILKRPFNRHRPHEKNAQSSFILLRGDAKLTQAKPARSPTEPPREEQKPQGRSPSEPASSRPPPEPTATALTPLPAPSSPTERLLEGQTSLFPPDHSVFMLTTGAEAEITFSWAPGMKGSVEIYRPNGDGSWKVHDTIRKRVSLVVRVPASDNAYEWRIVDESGTTQSGPMHFRVKPLDRAALKASLANPRPDERIFIY